MGIDDPKGYIEKRYCSNSNVTLLVTCAVGEAVVTEVEAAVEEAQSSGSWVDIMVSVQCTLLARIYKYMCTSLLLHSMNKTLNQHGFLNVCVLTPSIHYTPCN